MTTSDAVAICAVLNTLDDVTAERLIHALNKRLEAVQFCITRINDFKGLAGWYTDFSVQPLPAQPGKECVFRVTLEEHSRDH